jgi:hypothetical protein
MLLDSAHTWFFESASHELDGALIIRLVEGLKGTERRLVEVGEVKLGPHFPVTVESHSRCAQVRFENALTFFVVNESYDKGDSAMIRGDGRFLSAVTGPRLERSSRQTR